MVQANKNLPGVSMGLGHDSHTFSDRYLEKKKFGGKNFPGGSDPPIVLGVTILPAGQSA